MGSRVIVNIFSYLFPIKLLPISSENQAHLDSFDPYGNYKFTLQSCNEKGCSSNETSIYYHQQKTDYKMCVWTTFDENNYRIYWNGANEIEPPLSVIIAFSEENSMNQIHYIEGINTTANSFDLVSSKNPNFGIVATYSNFTTGIVWSSCKSEANNGLNAPEITLLKKSSTELRVIFKSSYCTQKAAADFYEITYCTDGSCSKMNVTNKDLISDEFFMSGLQEFTAYNVSVRIYNKFIGYGRSSKFVNCKTDEGGLYSRLFLS